MADNAIDYTAIRARLDAATPGPWVEDVSQGHIPQVFATTVWGPFVARVVDSQFDAELIAHSRTDLEQLLDRVEAARTLATSWREKADFISHLNPAVAVQMRICADELDAALDAAPAAPAVGEEKP